MPKLTSLLTERYILAVDDRDAYKDQVWDLLSIAYAGIGGFLAADNPDHLVEKSDIWKMVRRGGKIVAVAIYKAQHGSRKFIGLGHDGSRLGRRDSILILKADINHSRSWGEVSGRAEELALSLGAQPLPAKYAPLLLDKPIIGFDEDGYHYSREIGGKVISKLLYGPKSVIAPLINGDEEI